MNIDVAIKGSISFILAACALVMLSSNSIAATPKNLVCDWTDLETAFAEDALNSLPTEGTYNLETLKYEPTENTYRIYEKTYAKAWSNQVTLAAAARPGAVASKQVVWNHWYRMQLKAQEVADENEVLCRGFNGQPPNCPPDVISRREKEMDDSRERFKRKFILPGLMDTRTLLSDIRNAKTSCQASPFVMRYTLTIDIEELSGSGEGKSEWSAESCTNLKRWDVTDEEAAGGLRDIDFDSTPNLIRFDGLTDGNHTFNVDRRNLKAGFGDERYMQCRIEDLKTQI